MNVRRVARQMLPAPVHHRLAAPVRRMRSRAADRRARHDEELVRKLVETHGDRVLAGPFAGMKFVLEQHHLSQLLPKLLGTYELELHDELERLIRKGYSRIVNIGCGEGYYAVGLAMRVEGCDVFAFDIDSDARRLCQALSSMNGVDDRVHVLDLCDHASLERLATESLLVFVDCEGCELDLLRPDVVHALATADLLVEIHDFVDPSISSEIAHRFADTHSRTTINARPRDADSVPALNVFEPSQRERAVSELRPPVMQWFVLETLQADLSEVAKLDRHAASEGSSLSFAEDLDARGRSISSKSV